ncbi:MAG TPA: hypothetical protein PLE99_10645 [Candidatus Thiothrix moscowensis]|uniref:hypothetical protein n=1 Tax=unclassified Thiothrix TaxID=2636184 RepID=UPI0025D5CAC8|nr:MULTISPECIES: hypothetical protein [unclassified Thiothrix]HRJ53217.1 hypothetical protein [Candidatus Thiothrix moscowensis]HRJ93213.1 hypothetical protein [Candidatus Thiothrix moscowensis]
MVAEKGVAEAAALTIIPAILFCFLDAYYLALEKQFRAAYGKFINDLHSGTLQAGELYKVRADGKLPQTFLDSLLSWAV